VYKLEKYIIISLRLKVLCPQNMMKVIPETCHAH